ALVTCWLYDRVFGLSSLSGEASGGKAGSAGLLRRLGLRILGALAKASATLSDGVRLALGARLTARLLGVYAGVVLAFLILPALVVLPIG
ncbi:hypothetical protein ABTF68_21070, partial [Acinetobacter baumannii]